VVPIYYILFTLSTITGSAMLYQDFYNQPADAVVVFVFGCLLCFAGVALLTSGRVFMDEDGEMDGQSRPSGRLGAIEAEPSNMTEESVGSSVGATSLRTKKGSLRSVRHALRHLDSPLFRGRSPPYGEGLTGAQSFDSLYDMPGTGLSRTDRYASDSAAKVTHAPFGGREHAWLSSASDGRRSFSEDGRITHGRSVTRAPRADRGPPMPTIHRSRSAEGSRNGIEAGLLDTSEVQ
jgi:hypothetical protein